MNTFLAIVAGIVTFLVTQFIGALLIALLAGMSQLLHFIASYGPTKFLLMLLMWSGCAWLGVLVYGAIAESGVWEEFTVPPAAHQVQPTRAHAG